jgi:hypothetical protein
MKPSRILNDEALFFGLGRNDIMTLGGLFYFYQGFMGLVGFPGVGVILTIITAIILITVRMKYRKKIIRDFIFYCWVQVYRCGVYYDSKID